MSVSPADPALLKAQYRAFAGQLPLMYLVVAANTWLLAWTHFGHAPAWLTLGVPALLTGVCLARCVQWWRGRREEPDASAAHRALVRAGRMAWPVALAFSLWPLLLFPYGDAFLRSHVAFCMATTAAVSQLYLMHVRPAMLTIALVFNGGFILFFAATGEPTFVAMAVSVALMTFVLVTTLLRQYRRFTDLVGSRLRAERLGAENLRLANLDSLTRLPNRRAFFGALVQACERADARGTRLAVGIIDLDGFKPINDLYGHAAGDRLLKQVGQRLSLMASGRIHLARLGGDEFAMIAEDLGGDEAYVAFARSLCEQLRAPFQLEDLSLQVTATIGLVLYPDLACHAEDLYERADYALYHGKRLRRGGVSLFSADHQRRIQHEAAIEQALRSADLEAQLSVVFQPIMCMASGQALAFEALARWHHPQLGQVSPADFIPVAERAGLVHRLTRVLLRKALAEAARWPEPVGLSFNLSIHDLGSSEELERVLETIRHSGVHPARIDLEITETAVFSDMAQLQRAAGQLRGLGCGVSLDDFGTGFSSLSQLLALPLTKIKIDRRFVAGIQDKPTSIKIVRSLLALSRDMELGCVIEGVEAHEELAVLRELGGNLMQGYLFARPMSAEAVARWLARSVPETCQG
ncbi:putative bifunctional diguanylate cyclase/phosphodiesterase [Pseudoxanthomonas suwonensis]|uniref:putative bifunctional diguanylate cyclase/phosphodiesterase n=1 Tax=Pseudoxanthomonas suwonensis TaxID=314722 RepID=UPI0014792E7C|nr:EAL domain-containing protein [Pseudoxanthomonas suwonensis]